MVEARNLIWTSSDNTCLDCEILINGVWTPFAARQDDVEPMGPEIISQALAGKFGDIPVKRHQLNWNGLKPITTSKMNFLITLVKSGELTETEMLQAAQNNSLPASWLLLLEKEQVSADHVLQAKMSFSTETSFSQYTAFIQVMCLYDIWSHAQVMLWLTQ